MKGASMKYKVILEAEEEGGYSVHCPALPGCYSQGDTVPEALTNIQDAIELYIETLKDLRKPIPTSDPEILVEAVEVKV
jgi:predicted RNase H-like HicB family nuclease